MTETRPRAARIEQEINDALADLDTLLKDNHAGELLANRGVNVSLAMTALNGLRCYLHGDYPTAIDDLSTVAEEIASRKSAGGLDSRAAKIKPTLNE